MNCRITDRLLTMTGVLLLLQYRFQYFSCKLFWGDLGVELPAEQGGLNQPDAIFKPLIFISK